MVNGKQKGSAFEREVCKALSLWTTNGKSVDVYWRAAMSGGRATVAKGAVRQAGDITAVAPEGHVLTDFLYIECKHLKDISLDGIIKGNGNLLEIWRKTLFEAAKYNKVPVLIFKQNHWPIAFCTMQAGIDYLKIPELLVLIKSSKHAFNLIRFDELLKIPFSL